MPAGNLTFVAATVIAAFSLAPAMAAVDNTHQLGTAPRGWSAVEGSDPAALISHADDYDAGNHESPTEPYCDRAAEIGRTLSHDFGETLIDGTRSGQAVAQLWGSDSMGTWTLVLARADDISCVVASGIGYSSNADPGIFYAQAGLVS